MRPRATLAAAVLAALAATLAAAAPATAAPVSPAGVRAPQVAINADGAIVVAWERRTRRGFEIEARTGDAPLELGRTSRLAAGGYLPQVAIGPDGTRAVMWVEYGDRGVRSLRVAVAQSGHRFGRAQLVDRRRANVAPIGVAVQPNGRVVAIWRRSGRRIGYALAPRRHAFGRARNLAAIGQPAAGTIAVDPRDGSVVLAYGTQPTMSPPVNQQAAVRTLALSGRSFSAPTIVSAGAAGATSFSEARPTMASGPGGSAVAFVLAGDRPTLNIARRHRDGSWAAPERIAAASYGEGAFAVGLRAALPADGSALAAWTIATEAPGGLGGRLGAQTVASIAGPSAAFGPPQAITAGDARFDALAVASAGDEAFVATAQARGPVLLATRSAGAATLQPPATLATDGNGDVLLAAAGSRVVAGYRRGGRLQLVVVR